MTRSASTRLFDLPESGKNLQSSISHIMGSLWRSRRKIILDLLKHIAIQCSVFEYKFLLHPLHNILISILLSESVFHEHSMQNRLTLGRTGHIGEQGVLSTFNSSESTFTTAFGCPHAGRNPTLVSPFRFFDGS